MVKTMAPTYLCLDFDRTLCSTKRGACASDNVVLMAIDWYGLELTENLLCVQLQLRWGDEYSTLLTKN